MGGLKTLVIVLGVVILAMMATLVVGLAYKMRATEPAETAPAATYLVLNEPAGTRIVAISPAGDLLAILLQGGGQDRVFLIDPVHARMVRRIQLQH
jgi:hypothetical protein